MDTSKEDSIKTKPEETEKLTPDACHECIPSYDQAHPELNPHNITWDTGSNYNAKSMIANFEKTLGNAKFFGGTIYGSEDFFKFFSCNRTTGNVLKFHFCSSGIYRKLFIALEFDTCDANTGINFNVNASNLLLSLDENFYSSDDNGIYEPEPNSIAIKDPSSQIKSQFDIELYKDNLRGKNYFMKHFGKCQMGRSDDRIGLVGSFNFDASVSDIFRIALAKQIECKGIRYYFGYDSTSPNGNYIRVILVGIDAQGKNIPDTFKENSRPKKK